MPTISYAKTSMGINNRGRFCPLTEYLTFGFINPCEVTASF